MKGNSLFLKYILFILGIISLMPGMVYSQTFKHNEGIANKKGDYNWNGTQKCHELTYYYYVTKGQKELELTLPFANGMSDLEPRGYYRWYDWKTDAAMPAPRP